MDTKATKGLHILIAGAGIGGLSAAIALRQAGHTVEIFESSRFATELGAAIHLPPNINGLLRRYGIKPEDFQCNDAEFVTLYDSQGNTTSSKDVRGLRDNYPFPWQLSHRIDLHETLKRHATSVDGPGTPAVIHLRSKVVDCDPAVPSLTLDNGQVIQGDLLIGADGSTLRRIIAQEDIAPEPSGGSAFRFLIPVSQVKANPETTHLVARPGELQFWDGQYRRLVIYPCRKNTELNFVCLHPDAESQGSTEGWDISGSREHLLKVYDEFAPAMKALLAMADPKSIKLWRLLDRKTLGTWIRGKSCLIGDAAHPFLPRELPLTTINCSGQRYADQGQGGAQAIEDGAALAALLPLGTTPGDIPSRLQLYMDCRHARATLVQNFSRQAAFKVSAKDKVGGTSTDPLEFMKINFGHDAYDHASNMLLKATGTSSLSTSFGLTSLSQAHQALLPGPDSAVEFNFRTRRNYLETFLPSVNSRLAAPGGWARASWLISRSQQDNTLCEEPTPEKQISVALYISGITPTAGATEPAAISPVIFASDADFVLAGRERDLPLVLADICEERIGSRYRVTVRKMGRTFLELGSERRAGVANGGVEEHRQTEDWIEVAETPVGELEGRFAGLANVVGRLQGLEAKDVKLVKGGF
ncbi:hypothetical protein FE257_002073 [Aspergillus nanangensis]|uniref:FAD-binding domain-containing protein n=1 Tax=Aspergillus nanangensis TaxID=2582783 RepID=A0AAD4CTJ9_ASPNN|nr:hypothetical protein FE257_002073 [Aspergillus nanangensis]